MRRMDKSWLLLEGWVLTGLYLSNVCCRQIVDSQCVETVKSRHGTGFKAFPDRAAGEPRRKLLAPGVQAFAFLLTIKTHHPSDEHADTGLTGSTASGAIDC